LDQRGTKWRGNVENFIMRNFVSFTLQIKEDEVGGTCSMQGVDETYMQSFSPKRKEETTRNTWVYMGRLMLNGSLGNWVGSCGLDAADSGQGSMASCYERGDEPSMSVKSG
jgi:hypothetical protein